VSGIADPFNGHIDAFRIAQVQRSDGWIGTTWNNMSDPGAFAAVEAEEQQGGEPPPVARAGILVCLMGGGRTFGTGGRCGSAWGLAILRCLALDETPCVFGAFGAAWDAALVARWSASPLDRREFSGLPPLQPRPGSPPTSP
jgi:hypothetical protein